MAKRKQESVADSGETEPVQKPEVAPDAKPSYEEMERRLRSLEGLYDEMNRFTGAIQFHETELLDAKLAEEEAKIKYDEAKAARVHIEESIAGAKHNLFRFLKPTSGKFEFMPLFDRMRPADEEKHGRGCAKWREEPLAVLGLSVKLLTLLVDSDFIVVGQLQDAVQDEPSDWWLPISGLNAGQAAAVVDKLNDFIFERTKA